MLVQYWCSFVDIERFARNPHDPHLPAWRCFNRLVGADCSVNIFHETYIVEKVSTRKYSSSVSRKLPSTSPPSVGASPRGDVSCAAKTRPPSPLLSEAGLGFPPRGINHRSDKQPSGERARKEGRFMGERRRGKTSREDKNEGAMDKAKGRIKEATGALTGDKDQKAEGRADQRSGTMKEKKGKIKDVFK